MNTKKEEQEISDIIIIYKAILGIVELSLGLGILIFGHRIFQLYSHFRAQELLEDPHDLLIRTVSAITSTFSQDRTFLITILIILGATKVAGAIGLFFKQEWGLDLIVGLFVFLVPFDLYSLAMHPTLIKLIYFLINLAITLFLVQFDPLRYIRRLKRYFK